MIVTFYPHIKNTRNLKVVEFESMYVSIFWNLTILEILN